MPKTKHFYEYSAKCRDQVETYFSNYYNSSKLDPILLSYIKKYIIMGYDDYYAFMKAIPSSDNDPLVISPYYYSDIYNNRQPKFRFSLFFIILASYIKLIKLFILSFYFSLIKNKKDLPDIVYIRKKIYHDLGIGDLIGKNFINTDIKYEKIFWAFSKQPNMIGFDFINSYKGSINRTIISFIQALFCSIKDFKLFAIYFLPAKFYMNLQTESYIARNFINLNAKIFCGNLFGTL